MTKKCTLPDLREMMSRSKIEECTRPCPIHGRHIVKASKIENDGVQSVVRPIGEESMSKDKMPQERRDNSDLKQCPICGGSGKNHDRSGACVRCNGSGKVPR